MSASGASGIAAPFDANVRPAYPGRRILSRAAAPALPDARETKLPQANGQPDNFRSNAAQAPAGTPASNLPAGTATEAARQLVSAADPGRRGSRHRTAIRLLDGFTLIATLPPCLGLQKGALSVASLPRPNRNCVFRRFTPAPLPDAQPDPLQVSAHGRCLSAVGRPCHVQCRLAHRRQVPWAGAPSVAKAILPDGCVRTLAKRVFRRPMRTRSPETARGHAFR